MKFLKFRDGSYISLETSIFMTSYTMILQNLWPQCVWWDLEAFSCHYKDIFPLGNFSIFPGGTKIEIFILYSAPNVYLYSKWFFSSYARVGFNFSAAERIMMKIRPKGFLMKKKRNACNAVRYFRTNSHKFFIKTYWIWCNNNIFLVITMILKCY